MEFLEKKLYEIDNINNSNYKDEKGKNLKTPKLIKQYNLCTMEYIDYLKSYFQTTDNQPQYTNDKMVILDIASGTGILALSFLNSIYKKDKEYRILLNDILFKNQDDTNIRYIKSIIKDINKEYENIEIEVTDYDLKTIEIDVFNNIENFILISDPTISTKNANSFETINEFFENKNILMIFEKANYILFKDSVQVNKKYKKIFEYKKYDKLEEGLDFNTISKEDIQLLNIFNRKINNDINSIVEYNLKKLADVYFFNSKSKLKTGEESNYYYNGFTLDYASSEYQTIEEEDIQMKNELNSISYDEIANKYEKLKALL